MIISTAPGIVSHLLSMKRRQRTRLGKLASRKVCPPKCEFRVCQCLGVGSHGRVKRDTWGIQRGQSSGTL